MELVEEKSLQKNINVFVEMVSSNIKKMIFLDLEIGLFFVRVVSAEMNMILEEVRQQRLVQYKIIQVKAFTCVSVFLFKGICSLLSK